MAEDLVHADLKLTLQTQGAGSVHVTLSGWEQTLVDASITLSGQTNGQEASFAVEHPKLWSAEEPALYDLTLEVYDDAGNLTEVIPQKVGFRRFEMKDGLMLLNGKRIVFKGVNRHEFSSRTGRTVSDEEILTDILPLSGRFQNLSLVRQVRTISDCGK